MIEVCLQQGGSENSPWDTYYGNTAEASLYHDLRWKSLIETTFGHKTFYLYARNADGAPLGILPLVQLKSVLFGNMLVSVPYFNYGGVCARNGEVAGRLLQDAVRIAKDLHSTHIEFRQEKPVFPDLPVKTTKSSMRLNLPSSAMDLWKGFPSKLRSQINRAQKEGMITRIGKAEELESFYTVFCRNMRDLGTPVYPKDFFRNILGVFPKNSWICTVYMGETPVAAGFLLGHRKKMEIPWASSLREYNRVSPNMLLYWNCLNFSCEQGYEVFDFGRSTVGEGTYKFKEQWGARPSQLYWHYWLAEGMGMPELNPANPKYRAAIHCWKKLPLPVTNLLGPKIVKYLP